MHRPIIDLESLGCNAWKLDGLERGRAEIPHTAASDTVEMVVAPAPELEASSSAGM
jgi:hypothetical protein